MAATGLWPANQPAILILLALGGVFVVVVHDLLPSDILGPAKFVVEGSVAITLSTLLVALTGGVFSPFFFAFPLIVAGAALVVSPAITVALAGSAALGYVLARDRRVRGRHAADRRRRDRRRQPDRPRSAGLRGHGHRPRAAAHARRGDPAVDGRPADRACSTGRSSSPPSAGRSPAAPGPGVGSAC